MKKLFTLFALLMAIVVGAQADSYTLGFADETVNSCNGSYAEGIATFTCGSDVFTITNTGDKPKTNSNGNYTSDVKRYGVKYSQNVVFTVNIPDGISIKSVTFSGWSNSESAATKINKINDEDVSGSTGNSFGTKGAYDSWTYEFATAQTGSFTFVNKGAEGVFNITLTESSAPATKPTITKQPQDATYVIGTEDYPSMSVTATASAGELKYKWHIIIPSVGDIAIPGAEASTLSLATYATQMAAYLSQEGSYSIYCNVADDNDNVDSDMAVLTVTATAPVTPADPTFDKADGASMKAGDIITITSEGSTIYYRWSGKSGQTWTPEAFKDGRTPYDSPCTTTTSTKGDRYVYAMAEINGNYSNITSIKVTVSENPVKGQLDKTSDAVDQNADAPAVPVFTLVDADGNPSPASMGAEGSTKDIFVKYVVTGTEGIINLNSDATAIESISTATAGTATATITIKQNKDAYPIIDGEGTYEYTITVNDGSTPATGPVITTQPQDATYVIGTEDYPSMSVTATASAGELKYQWHIIVPSVGDIAIPGAEASTLSLATYASSPAFAAYLSQEGSYSIYCNVADDNNNVDSNNATLTIAEAPAGLIDPTFDKEDGDAIKAGDVITITSSAGSTIYYRWSGKSGQTWTPEAFKDGRTPNDSPCTTTTSTKGDRYLYAMAEINGNYSNITSIKVTVSENPVKGQLDKTSDAVDQNADAPAVPVFSLVDADGNPSPASMGAEGSTKDIFVKYVVTGTDGIINLNSDATAIESISTATAGTATATITIKQNKDAYPIIDGEGTYEYTITVNGGSTPATGLVINTQPQDVTYTIGDADYPSVTVEAEATVGTIFYDWQYSLNGNDFTSLTTMSITSASTNTLSGEEVFNVLAHGGEIPTGTYYLRCTLTNGDYSVETNTVTITVNKPAELTPVSASTTWDFADVTWDGTTNKNDKNDYELVGDDRTTEYAYKDVSGLTFANTFNANAIAFKGQYPIRSNSKKHAQNGVVRIATSCPGTIKVSFTDTGTKATTDAVKRYLVVNGEQTEYWTSRENNGAEPYAAQLNVTTGEINVAAGNITIEGTSAICVSKIVFTANATAINGVAENETSDAANVKVIKNGKLYIGKYNVAGQRVK